MWIARQISTPTLPILSNKRSTSWWQTSLRNIGTLHTSSQNDVMTQKLYIHRIQSLTMCWKADFKRRIVPENSDGQNLRISIISSSVNSGNTYHGVRVEHTRKKTLILDIWPTKTVLSMSLLTSNWTKTIVCSNFEPKLVQWKVRSGRVLIVRHEKQFAFQSMHANKIEDSEVSRPFDCHIRNVSINLVVSISTKYRDRGTHIYEWSEELSGHMLNVICIDDNGAAWSLNECYWVVCRVASYDKAKSCQAVERTKMR